MIYLAPLQGFTDFVYRKVYARVFQELDAFFIPYISIKNGAVASKYLKEIVPEHNLQKRVVPQILVKNSSEMLRLTSLLQTYNYAEVNLNLGCPYPMVTNRGKGSGLLPYPEKVQTILSAFFDNQDMQLSVKLRAGLSSVKELEQIIKVLNGFPLKEVILHPRIAKQLYSGEINVESFQFAADNLQHKLVFNGDIVSLKDYMHRKKQFALVNGWMLGRGILMNPFLPAEIKGDFLSETDKYDKLLEFHELMFENYLKVMDNEGNAINKMHQFWFYFSCNFANPNKAFKGIKKSKNKWKYKTEVQRLFAQL